MEAVQAQVQQQGAGAGGQGQGGPLPGGGRGEDGAVPSPGEVQEPPGRGHEPLPPVLPPAAVRARVPGQRPLRVGLLPLRPGLPAALDPGELGLADTRSRDQMITPDWCQDPDWTAPATQRPDPNRGWGDKDRDPVFDDENFWEHRKNPGGRGRRQFPGSGGFGGPGDFGGRGGGKYGGGHRNGGRIFICVYVDRLDRYLHNQVPATLATTSCRRPNLTA